MRRFLICFVVFLAAFVYCSDMIPNFLRYRADVKIGRAKSDLRVLSNAAIAYKEKQGRYPESLKDLVSGGYVESESSSPLIDPWGNEYRYDPLGPRNGGKTPDFWTVTPDQKEIEP